MRKKTGVEQDGFASIIIALVIVIVLSLLTVGFAQLARREQQDALNRQLASQAYYAAESGVNDVVSKLGALQTQQLTNPSTMDKNRCLNLPAILPDARIDNQTDVGYNCVLLDLKPPTIDYTGVTDRSSRHLTFTTTGNGLKSLKVSWGSKNTGKTPRTGSTFEFTKKDDWNAPGVIQFSLTKLGHTGTYNRDTLINNTFTAYLYPSTNSANTVSFNTVDDASQAPIVPGNCQPTGKYPCEVRINDINGHPDEMYLLRIVNYYDTTDLSINDARDGISQALFEDGQAVIDVTGKAKNVLKRIQVRVPLKPTADTPEFAIESQSMCKRFSGWPTTAHAPAPLTTFDGASPSCTLVP